MRHNENVKMLLAAGLLTLGAWGANAQVNANTWGGAENSDWNNGLNWVLPSGNHYVPSNNENTEFIPEYAVIDNGDTVNINDITLYNPLAVYLGNTEGGTGHLTMTLGSLNIDGLGIADDVPAYNGSLVVGTLGAGSFNISGGILNTSQGVIVGGSAGGTGTLVMSGTAEIIANNQSRIGAGGGEAALWTMTGGTFTQVNSDLNIADDNVGSTAIFNMSGGLVDVQSGDLDIAGLGGNATVDLSGGIINVGNDTYFGLNNASQLRMTMRGNTQLNTVRNLNMNRGGDLLVTLKEQAELTVAGALNFSSGTIRVEGTQVNINTLDLTLQGTYNPVINASGISSIVVSGAVTLGGTVDVELDGITASIGDSWRLIEGAASVFGNLSVENAIIRNGTRFVTINDGSNVDLVLESALTLRVNANTSAASIKNYVGGIEITGYMIGGGSGSGLINVENWKTLGSAGNAGFEESNPTADHITEISIQDSMTFGEGQSHGLGKLFNDGNTAFGVSNNNSLSQLKFEYSKTDGSVHTGILEIKSMANTLVLTVDSVTGETVLRNNSRHTVELDSYLITSENGSLDASGWSSLADQSAAGFEESNPDGNHISELDIGGGLILTPGQIVTLGNLMTAEEVEDLILTFTVGGDELTGIVNYGDVPVVVEGDYDWDGLVDDDDLDLVRSGFGTDYTLADLFAVRNNFGNSAAVTAVPEPASIAIIGLGVLVGFKRRTK